MKDLKYVEIIHNLGQVEYVGFLVLLLEIDVVLVVDQASREAIIVGGDVKKKLA